METVKAIIGNEKYKTRLLSSNNEIVADEPVALGGTDLGFAPAELLCASLASCTAITLRMYADRKEWEVAQISVTVDHERDNANNISHLTRRISIEGNLDDSQTGRLLAIANACPIHKLLTGKIEVATEIQ
jgi:putative redox protein